jgi:hypothetical protein
MTSLRNLVISLHNSTGRAMSMIRPHRLDGATKIAAALRHHARDALRPLQLLKSI